MGLTGDLLSCYKNFFTNEDEIYSDISVEVEDKIFPCHRFVLAACSPYFRGLLRFPSDKQETKSNSIKLKDVSSETFRIIYEFLYRHNSILNEDNLLDVWTAADFLQIDFIISECRIIANKTINERNYQNYFLHVYLRDKYFMPEILKYIALSFDHLKDSELVMELEGEELMSIVRDPNLRTSREENVVDTIFKWISYSINEGCLLNGTETLNQDLELRPHDPQSIIVPFDSDSTRIDFLVPLLSLSRLTSLDEVYLNSLLQHERIVDNGSARDLITKATIDKAVYRCCYVPTFASHRINNQLDDLLLIPNVKYLKNLIVGYSLTSRKFIGIIKASQLPRWPVLTVHKEDVYACGYTDSNTNMSLFIKANHLWQEVASLRFSDYIAPRESQTEQNNLWSFSIGEYVYVVDALRRNIFQCHPVNRTGLNQLTSVPTKMPMVCATYFEALVLIICRGTNDSAVLHVYDTTSQKWAAPIALIDVQAQNIAPFYKEDKLYFLTSDYKLYILESVDGGVTFKHLTSFPKIKESLKCALVYCEDLFIFVHQEPSPVHFFEPYVNLFKYSELFHQVRVLVSRNNCTNLVIASSHKETSYVLSYFLPF